MSRTIVAVDLFAGAGGTSTGLALACKELGRKVDLTAINHWKEAIETHTQNHPWAKHICQDIRIVSPEEVLPGLHAHIVVASPECIFHSRAAGGRPKTNQNRATAWDILPWLERIRVDNLLVENVPEFVDWGPLDSKGHPIKKSKGIIYDSWLRVIRVHGYNVDAKMLNAADYGAATSRTRLFIVAKKGNVPIDWPVTTYNKRGIGKPKWRPARQIIDWSLKGESIFTRKRPLSVTTIRRIIAGLHRFGGKELQPFLVLMEHSRNDDGSIRIESKVRGVDVPLPTISTAKGGSMGLVEPSFILSQASGGAPRSVGDPLPTIPAGGAHALIEPFILPVRGFFQEGGRSHNPARSVDEPLGTITQRGGGNLIEPFIVPFFGENGKQTPRTHSVDESLPTVSSHGAGGLVEPCLVQYNGMSEAQSVNEPLGTVTTKDRFGLVEPYILRFNGTTKSHVKVSARSVEEPLPSVVASSNHFALIQPEVEGCYLDIRFRMLQPHELAAAMGFPKGYAFKGTKTQIIKQIGNAVVVQVSKALCLSLLSNTRHVSERLT